MERCQKNKGCGFNNLFIVFLLTGLLCQNIFSAETNNKSNLPLISDIVIEKTDKAEKKAEEKKEIFPRELSAREANTDILEILPQGAVYYFESPNGKILEEKYGNTAIAQLLEEKSVSNFFKQNDFGLSYLLTDLPEEYSSTHMVAIANLYAEMVMEFIDTDGRIAVAGYSEGQDKNYFCFMADIGKRRKPAFDKIQQIIKTAIDNNPEIIQQKVDYKDDYIENIYAGLNEKRVDLAYGFIKNFLVISNRIDFARTIMQNANKGSAEKPLADDKPCRYINSNTNAKSLLRGYISVTNLKNSSEESEASYVIGFAEDLTNRVAVYYDLSTSGETVIENITIPIPSADDTATLASRLNMISQKGQKLNSKNLLSPKLMPVETSFYLSVKVKPSDMASLLSEERIFGSSKYSDEIAGKRSKSLMENIRKLAETADETFDGEISFAYLGMGMMGSIDCMACFPLRSTSGLSETLESFGTKPVKSNNVEIYTATGSLEDGQPVWAILSQAETSFRKLGSSFLVCASSGNVMEDIINRIIGGRATLLLNEDFIKQVDQVKESRSLVCYYNIADTIRAAYPNNIRELLQICYPKNQIHAMPTLSIINKYIFGMSVSMSIDEEYGLRFSFSSPMGVIPAVAVPAVLATPVIFRKIEEEDITTERQKLSDLNLALQEYATLYGKFPSTLSRTVDRDAVEKLLPEGQTIEKLLTNSSAAKRLGSEEEAKRNSWIYVRGLRPSDVPSNIILYTSKPFHYAYRTQAKKYYEPFRMVLTIDGNINLYPEDVFVKNILPNIKNND